MDFFRCGKNTRHAVISLASVLGLALAMPVSALAQDEPADDGQHSRQQAGQSSPAGQSLVDQIRDLQAKVARLEAALKQKHQAKTSDASGGMGMKGGMMGGKSGKMGGMMGGKSGKMGMGMMSKKKGAMSAKEMPEKGTTSGMKMMGGKMSGKMGMGMMSKKKGAMSTKEMPEKGTTSGMKMMGRMKGMGAMKGTGSMKAPEPLPGFPGAPGVYHSGATGFYLDHADGVSLTPDQKTTLNQIKEKAMSQQASFDGQIAEADAELGMLTGSDQPDAAKIDAQVRAIERLRGDQQIAFIRSVGRAAAVLTDQQRDILVGQHTMPEDKPAGPTKEEP
ncbi:MAG: Spy/CpxP family protein refolding chaperone [Pirellulaceae bacterium]